MPTGLSKGWCGYPGPSAWQRTIYQQLSPAEVHGQLAEWWNTSGGLSPGGRTVADAMTSWPARPSEWPLAEAVVQQPAGTVNLIRRRTDVVGIFPNRLSAAPGGRGATEQHDEWAEARRYLTIPNAAGNDALPTPNMRTQRPDAPKGMTRFYTS